MASIYLPGLDISFNLAEGKVESFNTIFGTAADFSYNDTIVFTLPTTTFATGQYPIFSFATSNTNITDTSSSDIRYYTNSIPWNSSNMGPNSNPFGSAIAVASNSKATIQYDIMRSFSNYIFGSLYGIDLFSNENDLSNSIITGFKQAATSIYNNLKTYDVSSAISQTPTTPAYLIDTNMPTPYNTYYYTTNEVPVANNICRGILDALINNPNTKSRFAYLDASYAMSTYYNTGTTPGNIGYNASGCIYRMPLQQGDNLSFKLVVYGSPGNKQTLLGNNTASSLFDIVNGNGYTNNTAYSYGTTTNNSKETFTKTYKVMIYFGT
jgi:hypothetical protein